MGTGELQQHLTCNVTGTEEAPLVPHRSEIHPSVLIVPYIQLCPRQNMYSMQAACIQCAGISSKLGSLSVPPLKSHSNEIVWHCAYILLAVRGQLARPVAASFSKVDTHHVA